MNYRNIAKGLGWFSIGLGLAEVLVTRRLASILQMENRQGLLRGFGFREIASGVGLLRGQRKAPWVWARVGGDLLDLAALAPRLATGAGRKGPTLAAAAVGGVTALDILCGRQLSRSRG